MTMCHPLFAKVGTKFAGKRRPFSGHAVLFFFFCQPINDLVMDESGDLLAD
jgi:hypothetical protein